ncbi:MULTISPECIES: aminotransferase class I/II-fold pyridoxal phosphate-dependent enzyme [Sneathia]|uniref:Aminotransferase n=1 Tax=Sneathia vaginalis TaxID=187101 RepID=A0A0E3ZBK1_9FUSO|nr:MULTISPECIES: aminotransferase class I/II-fold pyridoxal phosphate-dependent enzyme [Sneathia]AKC95187.1 aminotransferase class I/II [Sneathia vaginalis]MBE2989136.1 aminotransferase class I/II-fold pyridoxal phosphate-dependent enzyme [Sneathia sp. DSM 16630]MBE3031460.1 aminotransferase class I/II-fold pyridoxal phosphate-dependent enzyme [Sneathia sp. DSM 16631]MDK9582315.1 aminotransferase class I/II-fold pyridoxal phosphate-dependent enzyme [Sneathia vaginalis]
MRSKANSIIESIEISKIRQIALKMNKYSDGINLTIGEPSQDVPDLVKEEMANRVLHDKIGYTQTGGMPELKRAIVAFYNQYFGGDYKEENCLITVGSTEGLSTFIRSIVDEGDEVIMPTPTYPGYAPNIKLQKGIEVYLDTSKDDFKLTAKNLESAITPKTRAIILTYPNNPSGVCIDEDEMDKIADVIRRHDVFVLSDEIYASLAFEKYHSLAKYHDLIDKVVVINGFSKSHSMTGYRVGYMLASKYFIDNFIKVSQYTTTGIATISQYGGIKALEVYPTREEIVKENRERMEFFAKGLEKIGFRVIKPEGAFYLFADYRKLSNKKSIDFVNEVVENLHIGIVPGECFMVEGYVRFSVTKDIPELQKALDRMEKYFK